MKETYYFSHDYNARNDEKVMYLLSKYKWEGYGIYWLIIELLHEATNNRLNLSLLDGVAFRHNIDITLLQSVITTSVEIKLLYQDGEEIGSNRVDKNILELNEFRTKKSNAGKAGMAKRWGYDNTVITKHNKGKERKVKEMKVKESKVNTIALSDDTAGSLKEVMDIFYEINPTLNFGNKTYRSSAQWLIEKYGIEKTKNAALYAVSIQGEQYAPQILNPHQLKEKMTALTLYKQKQQPKGLLVIG